MYRSVGIPMGWDRRSVKPSAKPTLVRTQHLPLKTPGQTRCRCSRIPGLMRVRERFGRPFPVAVGQLWARTWLVSGVWRAGARERPARGHGRRARVLRLHFRRSKRSNLIWVEAPSPAVSRWVQLWHGRMTDGIPGVCAGSCGPAGGPVAGVEGFLDVLAGDLVAAGYAVCIDGEQDADAVPGAGCDLGGQGAAGQP
jgi:hypothetical protein